MKKKLKDLTDEEIITICDRYTYCGDCKLRFHGGDYCVRKYIPKEVFPEDILEKYFNREVKL